MSLILRLDPCDDPECPNEWDSWTFISFDRGIIGKTRGNREDYILADGQPVNGAIANKLKHGTAFLLDRYEHGATVWSIHGEGTQDRFDTSRRSGILLWNHRPEKMCLPKVTVVGYKARLEARMAARQASARGFLDAINSWINGSVYDYMLTDEKDSSFEARGHGFYDPDDMADEVSNIVKGRPLKVGGPCAWLVMRHDFQGKAE